ncbi:MAG: hypothetical protein HY770_08360 [Chitinivibrionia bacterium]|nr:hypothetical protein [Chitinivibrionia bacterium]
MTLLLFPAASAPGEEVQPPVMPAPPAEPPKEESLESPVVRLSEGVFRIGNVTVDQNIRQVRVRGVVNMQRGLVEYLAVADRGKLHESVLRLDLEPFHLQLGLLLMGLNYGRNLKYQGDPGVPEGDRVAIWVEWTEDGKKKRVRGEELVFNQETGKPMRRTDWVFSGSLEVEGTFLAQVERSLIATYHDPASIIDNPLPEGADDLILYANEKMIPPAGTPIALTIQAVKP